MPEEPRRLVAAARKLSRQHCLGLSDAGADQHLPCCEHVGDRSRIVAARRKQAKIRGKRAAQGRRGLVAVLARGDNLAIQVDRMGRIAGTGIEARKLALRAQQGGRAWISGLEQRDRRLILLVGGGTIAACFGDGGELVEDLGAHPDGRRDSAAADRDEPVERLGERLDGLGIAVLQAQRRSAQLQRLAVENLDPVLVGQALAEAGQPARTRRLGTEPAGGVAVDHQLAHPGADRRWRERAVELRQSGIDLPLVEQMDRAIVAEPPRRHWIARRHPLRLGE